MTVRFDTWVEADTPREAWEKLRLALEDKRMGDKLKNEFTATILEDGAEDKANIKGELTVRELHEFIKRFNIEEPICNIEHCPFGVIRESRQGDFKIRGCKHGFITDDGECMMLGFRDGELERITDEVRGYKPEGEER